MKESDIQKQILEYLKAKGYLVWRNYVGPVLQGNKRFTKNPMAGLPDILGICRNRPGVLFGIEVKTEEGVLSEKQKNWILDLKSHGALVFVADNIEIVIKVMETLDVRA